MPRFFVDAVQIGDGIVTLTGNDAHHISRSLRMAAGEQITVCDGKGTEYQCELTGFLPDRVCANILSSEPSQTEPPYFATVYQALPKGDKLDSVIQKAVECGASEIVLFESERCVAHERDDAREKRSERRNRIALEAAKQCGRGIIPRVRTVQSFSEAVAEASQATLPLFCYEGAGTEPLTLAVRRALSNGTPGHIPRISVMVGSEGGFSSREAEYAGDSGMLRVGLGKRILRTETAASFVLSCLVYELELPQAH